jgi:hypothetical protein
MKKLCSVFLHEKVYEVESNKLFIFVHREDYEIELNKLNLRIHFAAWFSVSNGVLQPQDFESSYLPLILDRRQGLAELRIAIMEVNIWAGKGWGWG